MTTNRHAEPMPRRQFASDNYAGICPEALNAMTEANRGHAAAYGQDGWTDRACDLIRQVFETDCEVFFTFNGTASNSLAVATICQPYHSVICHELAHLETDECGAPEFFSNGTKVLTVPGAEGKLNLDAVKNVIQKRSDIHYPKPAAISITQATEVGTVYSPNELRAVGDLAKTCDLRVHMDGARFANAVASLGVSPKEISWQAGVDVLCLGGTKNGFAIGEAVVFFNRDLAKDFDFRCKQGGQLASKTRFLSAPWIGMLESGAWLRRATQANEIAKTLESRLRNIPGVKILHPPQANSVFLDMPLQIQDALHDKGWHFYSFIGSYGVRLMCSWDNTIEDIDALASDLHALMR